MGTIRKNSVNSRINSMKVGDSIEFPLAEMSAIVAAKSRAKYFLAPETPEWEEVKDIEKAIVTIKRTM